MQGCLIAFQLLRRQLYKRREKTRALKESVCVCSRFCRRADTKAQFVEIPADEVIVRYSSEYSCPFGPRAGADRPGRSRTLGFSMV
jgi:hypothetical protein